MPPRSKRGHSPFSHRSSSSGESFSPPADQQTYRDLLIFEERLKQNAQRLQKRKRKYELFLAGLCAAIVWFAWKVLMARSQYIYLQYLDLGLLLVCVTSLLLFFASGMYSERVVYANKFVPQANRALRPFNMHLNTRVLPPPSRLSRLWHFFYPRSAQPQSPLAASPPRSPAQSDPSSSRGSSPTGTRRAPLAPPPPSSNPRGEIIFSGRVDKSFREGYDKYRALFEKRRAERLAKGSIRSAAKMVEGGEKSRWTCTRYFLGGASGSEA